MTRAELHKLERRAQAQPGAEAMQLWPFAWGLATVVLMSVFSGSAFQTVNGATHAYLGGIGLNLLAAAGLASAMCWVHFRFRSNQKLIAKQVLQREISALQSPTVRA